MRSIQRQAFTLVELLVVIAIIGVLVALLLPAVQAARESARRLQCTNQLRQCGLAVQNLASSLGTLPTGGVHPWPQIEDYSRGGHPFSAGKQGLSWAYQILPYLEGSNIHEQSTTEMIAGTPVNAYFCPSRRAPIQDVVNGTWLMDYAALVSGPSRADFAENKSQSDADKLWDFYYATGKGCTRGYGFWGIKNYGNDHAPEPKGSLGSKAVPFSGVIIRSKYYVKAGSRGKNPSDIINLGYPTIRMRSIEDGTSNTALITEKRLRYSDYEVSAWYDDRGWSDGWDPDVMRMAMCKPEPDAEKSLGGNADAFTVGSSHPGTFQVVFADGSVHGLNYDIELETFNQLAHRSDGQVLDESLFR